jgi:hypothetical protein
LNKAGIQKKITNGNDEKKALKYRFSAIIQGTFAKLQVNSGKRG